MKWPGMGPRYEAFTDPDSLQEVQRACNRIYEMRLAETAAGWASPEELDFDDHARTAMAAFAAGLRVGQEPDWQCLWDAYAMLQELERRLRTWDEDHARKAQR